MIIKAEFVSVWDGGYAISTECKVNTETKEVFDIEVVEDVEVDTLDEEYIILDGVEYDVTEVNNESETVDIDTEYWYI